MIDNDLEGHWENVHSKKKENEVSWYQIYPKTSMDIIKSLNLIKSAHIIDVGAGESRLVDNLLKMGFYNIDVLDISKSAIDKAKRRLGNKSSLVNWIVSDINSFIPEKKYDLWHDRAAFHFLKKEKEINNYVNLAGNSISSNGKMVIATFSSNGPEKCSGLEVTKYNIESINKVFKEYFLLEKDLITNHSTPFNTEQEFLFSSFIKK
ncbi:MAG: methyltransferase domain-containing protein [Pelagibacterales bacterium]|mgnify:FL=1|jgi:2-polyprenyl-3-methyl-5-hydroxy-6-metoxy-1,4-benzoquinol methylase|nr:methyltransferase domain-containing protein [Pelagibacterales bacterium]MDG1831390.1 class I SAM-dependent methyltransferase [Flavobacteriaceae bacterium]